MLENASRRGAVNLGTPLMILAFLSIGGFLYWLYAQAAAERELQLREAAEAAARAAELEAMGDLVTGENLQLDPTRYEGRTIRLEGLSVASRLGTQGVWLELPNQNPFLISFSEAVKAEGVTLTPGMTPTISGVVHAMSDSVLTAWTSSGAIGEGDRLAAEFATHFLEAERVRDVEAPPGGGPSASGDGEGDGDGGGN